MASTGIVWFRRDLRVHDHPALAAAVAEHERVLCAFVLDERLLGGRFASGARTAFLLGALEALDGELRARGAGLRVLRGAPAAELTKLARESGAEAVHWISDVSPFARERDRRVDEALGAAGLRTARHPGNFVVDVGSPTTQSGGSFSVFSPFWRAWAQAPRRALEPAPESIPSPVVAALALPSLSDLGLELEIDELMDAGESAARAASRRWLDEGLRHYEDRHDRLAGGTSMLSPHLHLGCLSARELEEEVRLRRGRGPEAFRRQLCWRDFYAHVLLHNPANARLEYQERYRELDWDEDDELLAAWREGRTGYPVVDAAMRQLRSIGWMHNRARLIVGSFLTKDLHLDWRHGEAHFMRHLLDGDEASNNGNWQWIASVGVDPAPYFRRMFNPVLQQRKFDPDGEYVRRWVPELRSVPTELLFEPWKMSADEQRAYGCVVGADYPAPIVEHQTERRRAIERYRAVGA